MYCQANEFLSTFLTNMLHFLNLVSFLSTFSISCYFKEDVTRYLHVPIPKQNSPHLIRSGHLYLLTVNDYHTSTMLKMETNISCYMANLNGKKNFIAITYIYLKSQLSFLSHLPLTVHLFQ